MVCNHWSASVEGPMSLLPELRITPLAHGNPFHKSLGNPGFYLTTRNSIVHLEHISRYMGCLLEFGQLEFSPGLPVGTSALSSSDLDLPPQGFLRWHNSASRLLRHGCVLYSIQLQITNGCVLSPSPQAHGPSQSQVHHIRLSTPYSVVHSQAVCVPAP